MRPRFPIPNKGLRKKKTFCNSYSAELWDPQNEKEEFQLLEEARKSKNDGRSPSAVLHPFQ